MNLDSLRNRLRELDHEILNLASRRQEIAVAIGREKAGAGLPTRDYRQEKEVVQRARDSAAELGLPPGLAERITLALIEASLTVISAFSDLPTRGRMTPLKNAALVTTK